MSFWKKRDPESVVVNPLDDVDVAVLRRAEQASEMTYALARILESADHNPSYVDQVRSSAHAARELARLHPDASDVEEDSGLSAGEHTSEIVRSLSKRTYQCAQLTADEQALVERALTAYLETAPNEDEREDTESLAEQLRRNHLQFWPKRDSE
ncbi:hypothetical protein GCM10009691_41350 [Brevibacterium picturae]|uniref:Uncharacterized protein n=2 Tax=Brevibacterium picturae TaxID=260553 RepID=A0ABN2CSJ4_9MICO